MTNEQILRAALDRVGPISGYLGGDELRADNYKNDLILTMKAIGNAWADIDRSTATLKTASSEEIEILLGAGVHMNSKMISGD